MNLQIIQAPKSERETIDDMMYPYLAEMNPYLLEPTIPPFSYPYLPLYWVEENRIPFLIQLDNEVIGFVLVNDFIRDEQFNATKSIAEFYIKPAFRKQGIGKEVAFYLFRKYPEKWEICQPIAHKNAQAFWRSIIAEFTNGNFGNNVIRGYDFIMAVQTFESSS